MADDDDELEIDRMALLRRYGSLLKKTVLSFVLSTAIHISIVLGYYYVYLYLNPDDPGKKKFYATTTTTPGVKIGNRVMGRGGVQTNHHKSYLLHLVREHYRSMSKMFFLQFSIIYLILLALFKFFPEREKLREDTMNAFHTNNKKSDDPASDGNTTRSKTTSSSSSSSSSVSRPNLATSTRKRFTGVRKMARAVSTVQEEDEFVTTDEDENAEEVTMVDVPSTIHHQHESTSTDAKKQN